MNLIFRTLFSSLKPKAYNLNDELWFQMIYVTVELTASHFGNFYFRICANNDVTSVVTQDCLDENLLADVNGNTR